MAHTPQHDSLFREVFSLPLVARQFLTRWLPPEFVELVDWSTLRVERISGVNTALVERQEDVVYRVKAGGTPVWFYLLIEHQSRPETVMPLRVLEYTVLVWQEHRRQFGSGRLLPLVVPVVLYPGPGRWTSPRRLRELIDLPAAIRSWAEQFAPDASFLVVELGGLPLEELADGDLGQAVLGALQAERSGNLGFEAVQTLVERLFAEPERQQALAIAQHLWTYLLYHSELQSPEIDQIVTSTIPDEGKEQFMSTAEMLMQKGVIVARQRAVLDALEIRFGHVAPGLLETIEAIHDETRLRSLYQTAIQAASLEDFSRAL
jgi:hypothetical protein